MAKSMPKTGRMYLWITVLSAVIAAGGHILAANWDRFFHQETGSVRASHSDVRPTPPQDLEARIGGFGNWIDLDADVTYRAETDGFVAAYTKGDRPAKLISIYVGVETDTLTMRTRAGRWDGTVCPVAKGDCWLVMSRGTGEVVVQWLPISSSSDNR